MQSFKGDAVEKKFWDTLSPVLDVQSDALDDFWLEAYTTAALGDMLFQLKETPLANAIVQQVFRAAFSEIFTEAFVRVGTFEAYLSVFKKIFGDDVEIEFEVPGPGKLNINIDAQGTEVFDLVARTVVGNEWVYDNIVTQANEQIEVQSVKGLESEYEVEVMMFQMVPAGIFTQINLTIGGA